MLEMYLDALIVRDGILEVSISSTNLLNSDLIVTVVDVAGDVGGT